MLHIVTDAFTCEIPMSYGDLTLDQFFKLWKKDLSEIEVLSVLSGISVELWENCSEVDIDEKIDSCLGFLSEPADFTQFFIPDKINIGGVYYNKPEGIGPNTFGQKLSMEHALRDAEKEGKGEIDIMPYIISLYMQPIVTDSVFSSKKAEALVSEIMKCKIKEAWPIGSFFLKNYHEYRVKKQRHYLTSQQLKKNKQALAGLVSSENFQQFSIWRRLLIKILIKFYSLGTLQYMPLYYMNRRSINSIKS